MDLQIDSWFGIPFEEFEIDGITYWLQIPRDYEPRLLAYTPDCLYPIVAFDYKEDIYPGVGTK